jgi:hypothetical protein
MGDVTEPGKYYSPRMKKGIAKLGETFDAAGKSAIGLAGLSSVRLSSNSMFLLDLSKIGFLQIAAAVAGLFFIGVGIYWQAEAER